MSGLRAYDNPELFWSEVSPTLFLEETKNSLALGCAHMFRQDPSRRIFQTAVFEGDRLLGSAQCVVYSSNHNLVSTPVAAPEVAQQILNALDSAGVTLNGIVAETRTAEIYAGFISTAGRTVRTNMKQGIYRCQKVKWPKLDSKVSLRLANESEIPLIGDWIEAFRVECVPFDPPFDTHAKAREFIAKRTIYVLDRDGCPVTMLGCNRDIGSSICLNLVYTPPEFRKQGYASQLVAWVTDLFLKGGKRETNLYTDMSNPTSNRIYQNVGYEFVCNSVHFSLI